MNENAVVRVCQFCGKPFFRQVGAVERHSVGLHYCNRREYLQAAEPEAPHIERGPLDPHADLLACKALAACVLRQAYADHDYTYLRSPPTQQFAELVGDIACRWLNRVLPECTP